MGDAANASVREVALDAELVWVVGGFTRIGGEARHYLACLDRKTGTTRPFRADLDKPAQCLARIGDVLLVGGEFDRVRGASTGSLVAFDVRDGSLRTLAFRTKGAVRRLVVGATHVLALGRFSTERGPHASDALVIDKDTLMAKALPLTLRASRGRGSVDVAAFHGDRLVIAGEFTHVNGVERENVAEIDLDGHVTDWAPKLVFTGGSPFVETIAVHDGIVALAGGLVAVDLDPPVSHVLRFERRAAT